MAHFSIKKSENLFCIEDQPNAAIIERSGGIIVVKVKGHQERHGIGIYSYKPTEYQIWLLTEAKDCGETLEGNAEWVIDFPANSKEQTQNFDHYTGVSSHIYMKES